MRTSVGANAWTSTSYSTPGARGSAGSARARRASRATSLGASLREVTNEREIHLLLDAVPERVYEALRDNPRRLELNEIVLDLGRRPYARFADEESVLSESEVTYEDLDKMMERVGDVGQDNRAGINGTLHRISAIKNRYGRVVGVTCRVGRAITGSAELIRDVLDEERTSSILLLGRPGVGKTTAIREISRILADEHDRRVVIVDTSNEIAGDGDVPHVGIGLNARRMQVPMATEQHLVLIEAVENHTPQTIVVDEIGTERESDAARTISERGVQLIGTAHGHTLENVLKNPALADLVGGVLSVTLGDDEARRRGVQKSVLERASLPTFDICVEMLDIGTWRVHTDVAASVDALLAGQSPITELREMNSDGTVEKRAEYMSRSARSTSLPDGTPVASIPLAYDFQQGSQKRPSSSDARQERSKSSSQLAALEVSPSEDVPETESDVCNASHAVKIFPFKLSIDALRRVMKTMSVDDQVCIVDLLEDATVVIAPKAQVKSSTWLRHAARARGMPIYAVRTDSSSQIVRALQAILGLSGASDGMRSSSSIDESSENASVSDAIEEARLAVERLVIPHRESVELLPRSEDIIRLQEELVDTYSLHHEAIGEGSERRLRIDFRYVTQKAAGV